MRTSLLDSPPHGRRATWTTHQGQRSKAPPEVQNQPSTAEGEPFLKPPSFCDRPKKRSTQQKPGRRLRQTAQHPKGAGKPKPHAETAERPHKMSGSPKTSPRPSPPGLGTAVSPVNVLLRTQPRGLSFTGVGLPTSTNVPVPRLRKKHIPPAKPTAGQAKIDTLHSLMSRETTNA